MSSSYFARCRYCQRVRSLDYFSTSRLCCVDCVKRKVKA
jgi:hypothetical protein